MGVSVVGGSTSSGAGLTPFDPSFGYNFPGGAVGQTVDLDMQSNIPAGTYTIEGKTSYKSVPRTVQLLNSSNTVVGSATLTVVSEGSLGTANSGEYSGSVVASQGFSKIKLLGSSSGSSIAFTGTPSSPNFHIKLSPGVRNVTSVSLADLFLTDPSTLTYTNMPTARPSSTDYPFMSFFYNGKTYIVTSTTVPGTSVSTGTATIRIFAWDHTAGTWSASLASMNPTDLGFNSYAAPGTAGNYYASVYPFKNGKILFKFNYWFNSGTQSRGQLRFFTFDTTNNSFVASTAYDNNSTGAMASAAYNPTEDAWYVLSRAVYNSGSGQYEQTNRIWKFKNDFSMEYMNFVSYFSADTGASVIMCENKSNPKFLAMSNSQDQSSVYRAVYYAGWTANGTYSGDSLDMGNAGNSAPYYPMWSDQDGIMTIQTTLFGQSSILALSANGSNLQSWGGPYTFPSAQVTSVQQIGYTNFNKFATKSPAFSGAPIQRWRIQPINSTQTAVVITSTDFTQTTFGTFGVRAVPLPSAVV